jgi:hypothetical protein
LLRVDNANWRFCRFGHDRGARATMIELFRLNGQVVTSSWVGGASDWRIGEPGFAVRLPVFKRLASKWIGRSRKSPLLQILGQLASVLSGIVANGFDRLQDANTAVELETSDDRFRMREER